MTICVAERCRSQQYLNLTLKIIICVLYEEIFVLAIYLMLFIYCYLLIYILLSCENKLTFASTILIYLFIVFL